MTTLTEIAAEIETADSVVAQHAQSLAGAREQIAAIQARLDAQAGPALDGGVAEATYNTSLTEFGAATTRLAMLERAHRSAEQTVASLKTKQTELHRAEVLKRVGSILEERAAVAARISALTPQLAEAFLLICKLTGDLKAAYGSGILPGGSLGSAALLTRALEIDLYRVGGSPFRGVGVYQPPQLPGARCPDIRKANDPAKLPSFGEQVATANASLIAFMTSQPLPRPVVRDESASIDEVTAPAPKVAEKPKTQTADQIMATMRPIKLAV